MDRVGLADQIEQLIRDKRIQHALQLCDRLIADLTRQPGPRQAKGGSSQQITIPVNERAIRAAEDLRDALEAEDMDSAIDAAGSLRLALIRKPAGEKGE